jgi:hypothetical protein
VADNVKYTEPGSGTLFATKDDGTAHHQKVITEGLKADASVQQIAKQEDEQHASGDLGVMALGVRKDAVTALAGSDADYQPMIFDASGRLWVNNTGATQPISAASLPLPTGAATSALQGGGLPSALASDRLKVDGSGVTQPVSGTVTASNATGDLAHDDADSTSKPVKIGGRAIAHGSNPSAVAADDRTNWYFNRAGVPFVIGGHPNIISIGFNLSSATSNAALITISTGSKIVITQIQVIAGTDVSTTPSVLIGFGTANTPAIGNAGNVLSHPAIPGGGGVSRGDGSGIIAVGADDEDLRYTTGTITGGSVHCLVSYYTVPS